MEREKPTKEGKILKGVAAAEMVAGVGVLLFAGAEIVGFALIAGGGLKWAIIKRAEKSHK